MGAASPLTKRGLRVIVIGAGIGGLAAAARLAQAGAQVTVFERHDAPGGKMRCLPSPAGPVDAGPTVLTLRPVFDDLFAALGTRLEEHLTLLRQPLIARHFWPDGSKLDLFDDDARNARAISEFAGPKAARQFARFSGRARALFHAFDGPVMQSPAPSFARLAAHVMTHPRIALQMAPLASLHRLLSAQFDDPRLIQLIGRYATYVGGSPYRAPALLALIWHAESAGVWAVEGGMHRLAQALEELATARGATFHYGQPVHQIDTQEGRATGVVLDDGTTVPADAVLFNGDPRALALGLLGGANAPAAPQTRDHPRTLSAEVWAFAARATGPDLAHHNVFFRGDPKPEFDRLAQGQLDPDPTIYVCAMDRGLGTPPPDMERFETIANAPPLTTGPAEEEIPKCRTRTFQTLARFGLTFDPAPPDTALTTPQGFDQLFPGSAGALYGQSPHRLTAALQRPQARTPIQGLYLTGGGAHPGAGVPMAALSARHAAEAILNDPTLISRSRPMAMPGGISTASATGAGARSASSRS